MLRRHVLSLGPVFVAIAPGHAEIAQPTAVAGRRQLGGGPANGSAFHAY